MVSFSRLGVFASSKPASNNVEIFSRYTQIRLFGSLTDSNLNDVENGDAFIRFSLLLFG
jgi:hypothetical protein